MRTLLCLPWQLIKVVTAWSQEDVAASGLFLSHQQKQQQPRQQREMLRSQQSKTAINFISFISVSDCLCSLILPAAVQCVCYVCVFSAHFFSGCCFPWCTIIFLSLLWMYPLTVLCVKLSFPEWSDFSSITLLLLVQAFAGKKLVSVWKCTCWDEMVNEQLLLKELVTYSNKQKDTNVNLFVVCLCV